MDTKSNKIIDIINTDGSKEEVTVITYLLNKDTKQSYIVYTKNEKQDDSYIIYISKIFVDKDKYIIKEIIDNNEWLEVQKLLKEIANAK